MAKKQIESSIQKLDAISKQLENDAESTKVKLLRKFGASEKEISEVKMWDALRSKQPDPYPATIQAILDARKKK